MEGGGGGVRGEGGGGLGRGTGQEKALGGGEEKCAKRKTREEED